MRERRRFGERILLLSGLALLSVGCGGSVKTNPLPGGGYVVACEKGISNCISRAEVLCSDKGYTIVGGVSTSKVLGGSNSAYRKLVYSGELSFYCGPYEVPKCSGTGAVADESQVYQLSATDAPPAVAQPTPVPVPTTSPRVCVPGTTQTCVGAGACSGGQVCTTDGLGFGPCDCGGRPVAVSPSVPAAVEPSPQGPGGPKAAP